MTSLALILLVSASCFALGQPDLPPERAADRLAILRSISEISKAYVARDPEPFERLYLSNFLSVRDSPVFNMRTQLIAMMTADSIFLRAGKKLDFRTILYESENPQFNFYGRTAIVNLSRKNNWQYRDQKCNTRTQATEVWVKPETDWKIAANHTTIFQCSPKPVHPPHPAIADLLSQSKAPLNSDLEAERQVRELIKSLVAAQASLEDPAERIFARFTSANYVSTDIRGTVGSDRSLLAAIPVTVPSRAVGFRNQDDAVLIYDNAAVYTFRMRNPVRNPVGPSPSEGSQQCSIILARVDGKWLIVASHFTKLSGD